MSNEAMRKQAHAFVDAVFSKPNGASFMVQSEENDIPVLVVAASGNHAVQKERVLKSMPDRSEFEDAPSLSPGAVVVRYANDDLRNGYVNALAYAEEGDAWVEADLEAITNQPQMLASEARLLGHLLLHAAARAEEIAGIED
jgi:hypothetical protein